MAADTPQVKLTPPQRKVLHLLADGPDEGMLPLVMADRLFVRTVRHSITALTAAGLVVQPEGPGLECRITDAGRGVLAEEERRARARAAAAAYKAAFCGPRQYAHPRPTRRNRWT